MKQHPYASFVHRVQRPARYIGGEYNQSKKDWNDVQIRMCLAFPDVYDIGMSHLGTKILYSILNKTPDIAAERVFAPWLDMEVELRQRNLPLISLESARPLSDFDVVGFSLQYEMTYTNVLNMLDLGGITVRSAQRGENEPFVIAGGPTATHPEPMAPFIDAFVIGDGEEKLPELLRTLHQGKQVGLSRSEQLKMLANLGGIYVPSLYLRQQDERSGLVVVSAASGTAPLPVVRTMIDDINRYSFPDDSPEPAAEAIFDRMSIEIARGCTEGCRFCQAGMIYRPVRERDPEAIVTTLVSAIEKGGYDEASLTCLSTADYSCISPLIKKVMERLKDKQVSLSVSSLRAYGLPDDTLEQLRTVRAGGLTFAPEAGTQRMRDVVNKNVSEQDIVESAHRVFSKGWTRMKLYFMIGLPSETDDDVVGIVDTAATVRDVGFKFHPRGKVDVTASVSSHVPKPHTPFQWCAMDTPSDIRRKQDILSSHARKRRITLKWHESKVSFLEGMVARGDWRIGDVIEAAWKRGARFDGWDEVLQFDVWTSVLEELQIDPQPYLGTLPVDGGLPWDHIDVGLEPGFLKREYRRALRNQLSPPCGKPLHDKVHHTNLPAALAETRRLICYNCGVACDLDQMKTQRIEFLQSMQATVPPPPNPPIETLRREKFAPMRPPKRNDQGTSWEWRIVYTKLGGIRLTSHLDMVRMLPRVLRRANLPVRMTLGFNQKSVLSFGPALPLGTWSTEEVFDVSLLVSVMPEDLLNRLNAVAPAGMRFTKARQMDPKEKGVSQFVRQAEYLVAAPIGTTADELNLLADAFMKEDQHFVERTSKKSNRTSTVDIRPVVVALSVQDSSQLVELSNEAGPLSAPVLKVRLRLDMEPVIRPDEVLRALLKLDELPEPRIARIGLFGMESEQSIGIVHPPPTIPDTAATPTHASAA